MNLKAFFMMTVALGFFLMPAPFLKGQPAAAGDSSPKASRELGGVKFEGWAGLDVTPEGAAWKIPGEAVYTLPDGPKGAYEVGLSTVNDSTLDARSWYGLRFDIKLDRDAVFVGELTASIPPPKERDNVLQSTKAEFRTEGKGWHTVTLPFSEFDYNRGQDYTLKNIKKIVWKGSYEGAKDPSVVSLRKVRLVAGDVLRVDSYIRSKPADGNGTVSYTASVLNTSEESQLVTLAFEHTGWEGMKAEVSPNSFKLAPGESRQIKVSVTVPDWLPGGARESQTLVITPQSHVASAQKIEFITLRRLASPYLVHTEKGWDEVKAKAAKLDWAKEELADVVKRSDAFEVPTVPAEGMKTDNGTTAVFKSYIEQKLWPCAVAWKLTGDKRHGEKVALFLRRLADPETGYPKRLHLNSQGIPQEGGLWEVCAWSYDLIKDSGLLSAKDKELIENSLRLYTDWVIEGTGDGGISNWSVFNLSPAAQCALAIQDMDRFNKILNGPCGLINHLRYGAMDDGWWYEMSLAYNLGCAEAYTNLAIAAEPFGIDLIHTQFPVATTRIVGLRPFEFQNFLGMAFGKYGPVKSNTISIKKMWDGIAIYPDYRGVMFGMGDGHEHQVAGGNLEKAYYVFRDPAYASIIKRGDKRDLLYGIPELPADTPVLYSQSGFSENAGLAVLRSQTAGREAKDQIQAAFKYGTHGSYHGHFDRISLLSLMRYGRSFYNPETSWFGYGSYMYKWWVQVSLSHNMVVVDAKQQEPQECRQLLFHSGPMMQAVAAETVSRWSNPPYMGGYDQIEKVKSGDAPYVPIPENHPKPGDLTDFTEPVRQRRLQIVTDDYVIIADDLKGDREHTFDNLTHLRGAKIKESANVHLVGHDAQFDSNPLGSGQFISNVDRYAGTAPVLVQSIHRIGGGKRAEDSFAGGDGKNFETGGAKSLSEPGNLHLDEYVLWPAQPEVLLADYAESWPVNKKLTYEVLGDDKSLASGTFGAWILGSGQVDVDLRGVKTLELHTSVTRGNDTRNTVFWGSPSILTADGKEISLAQLQTTGSNVIPVPEKDKDYDGGPVRIAGLAMPSSWAAEPKDTKAPGIIRIDLTGLNAVRFKASAGGDWPVGNEEQLRKTVSVRAKGKTAQFLTVIEPYEDKPLVKSATASGPGKLRVELNDGRVQEISIENLESQEGKVSVSITESRDGKLVRKETTEEPPK